LQSAIRPDNLIGSGIGFDNALSFLLPLPAILFVRMYKRNNVFYLISFNQEKEGMLFYTFHATEQHAHLWN
jgi:hypothetical protein